MFKTQTVHSPELGRDITVRSLSAAGVYRLACVTKSIRDDKARKMAIVLEHLRDGVVDYPLGGNESLMDFARSYPELAARLFVEIRKLTGGATND